MKNITVLILFIFCFVHICNCETYVKYRVGDAIPGEYIVTLRKDLVSSQAVDWCKKISSRITTKYGIQVKREFNIADKYHSFQVKGSFTKVRYLYNITQVSHIEENRYLKTISDIPVINEFNSTVCYEEKSGRNLWGLSRISRRSKIPTLFKSTYSWGDRDDGSGVDAYVLDTGIYLEHEEFEGRASWGFMASSFDELADDLNGHGTHVAGTIGGHTFGVAKDVNLIAVKVLNKDGVGAISDIIEGIDWMVDDFQMKEKSSGKKGKAVANLSLGARGNSVTLEFAAKQAVKAGINFVVAAGNEFDDACDYTPAHIPSVIAVGATNIDDKMSTFSNYGDCVDILAAGEGILSAYPGSPTSNAIAQGTSMASPHVAGVAARILSKFESALTPSELWQVMRDGSTKDAIDLSSDPGRSTTPNRLVYQTCGTASLKSRASIIHKNVVILSCAVMILSYILCLE